MDWNVRKDFFSCTLHWKLFNLEFIQSRIYAHEILLLLQLLAHILSLQHFPSHFSSSTYWNRWRFFFSTRLPATPLEVTWLGLETVRLSKRPRGRKGGPECRLFFMLKQPHAPRRPCGALFRQIGRKNFAVSDVCNWQIILMVILSMKRAIVNRTSSIPWLMRNVWCRHIDINQARGNRHMLLIT